MQFGAANCIEVSCKHSELAGLQHEAMKRVTYYKILQKSFILRRIKHITLWLYMYPNVSGAGQQCNRLCGSFALLGRFALLGHFAAHHQAWLQILSDHVWQACT